MNLFYILIYAENFMCIYRNFLSLTKNQKIIAITRIIVELSLSIAITVNNVILSDFVDFDYSDKDKLMTDILQFLTLFKSLVIVIGGVVTAEAFSRFTDNLRKLHNCFKDNEYYENAAKNLRVKCLVGFVVFTVMGVILLLVRLIDWYSLETYLLREIIILVVHELWVDIRYTLEHLVVYCAITTTYNYLKCLSIAVNDVLKRYNEQDNTESSSDGNEDIVDLPKKVNYWTEKYQNIMACCKNISLCYQELESKVVDGLHDGKQSVLHLDANSILRDLKDPTKHFRACSLISKAVEQYDVVEKRASEERKDGKDGNKQILTIHDLDEWAMKYRDLVTCSNKLSACFSSQVTDHIVFSMVGAYVFLYAIFSAYFVIFAGQHLLNENAVIKKSVATLYSTWSTRPQAPETKRLRNLNKLVNVNPIQIEYTNKIVLGMYLVPIIMSLSASYVIVGLQFNHESKQLESKRADVALDLQPRVTPVLLDASSRFGLEQVKEQDGV
ncbi:unnamed protein product [Spodoptera exigua]|nr:unnamed protein product [Spodoptera exigua]